MNGHVILIVVGVIVVVLLVILLVAMVLRRRHGMAGGGTAVRERGEAPPAEAPPSPAPSSPAASQPPAAPPRPAPPAGVPDTPWAPTPVGPPGAPTPTPPPVSDQAGTAAAETAAPESGTGADAEVQVPEGLDDLVAELHAIETEVSDQTLVEPKPPRLRDRIGRTRALLGGYLGVLKGRGSVDAESWEELEEALILADVGVTTTTKLLDDLRDQVKAGRLRDGTGVVAALKEDLAKLFEDEDRSLHLDAEGPNLWLFVGVNGVGKTTTIGKLAMRQMQEGRSVVLAAGDTFRAAAGEQLETWADRAGAGVIRGADGADPSSVIFDAVQHASARDVDLVLADTAGRLHTKVNLMEELRKVRRVAERPPAHLTEVLLVLDATTGQNGLAQARQFTDTVGVTGIVLTKLDGTAKGGIVIAIRSELSLPIKLVGLGEGAADLVPFDPTEFVDSLFS